jgi:hypothetical protein
MGAAWVGGAPATMAEVGMRSIQRTLALALTVALGLAFLPVGCGGSLEPAASARGDGEVPERVALQIRTCAVQHMHHLGHGAQSVSFDVKLGDDGQVEQMALRASTLGDEELEACMASALRALAEDDLVLRRAEGRPSGPVAPEARALMGQFQAAAAACFASPPGCVLVVGVAGLTILTVWVYVRSSAHPGTRTHPPPAVTTPPTQPSKDPKPAGDPGTTGPTPPVPPKPPDCPRNERFTPDHTDDARGCIDKKGNLRCYSGRHAPCAGVHTHGILKYQELRNGICKEITKYNAVRCEGPFMVTGSCGSVSTTECRDGGPEISGVFVD